MSAQDNVHPFREVDRDAVREQIREVIGDPLIAGFDCAIELAWSVPAPGTSSGMKVSSAQLFGTGPDDVENMIDRICELVSEGCHNIYFGVALRDAATHAMGRHDERDCVAVLSLKVDCDDPGCLSTTLQRSSEWGMAPTYAMYSGVHPHERGGVYWRLAEPALRDQFELVRQIEKRMRLLFGSDRKVAGDIARVMRVAGAPALPYKEGRILEMTGPCRDGERRKAPYTLEELDNLTRRAAEQQGSEGPSGAPRASPGPDLDFGEAKPRVDIEGLLAAAMTPHQFHDHALSLVMSLIARGTPAQVVTELVAGRITANGHNVEERLRELTAMVKGAVERVATEHFEQRQREQREQQHEEPPHEDAKPNGDAKQIWPMFTLAQALQRPMTSRMRIKRLMPLAGTGVLYGPPRSFKSFLLNDLMLCLALGRDWCGRRVEQCAVLYLMMEGQFAFPKRGHAWVEYKGESMTPDDIAAVQWLQIEQPINFLDPQAIELLARQLERLDTPPGMIGLDTTTRAFGAGKQNNDDDMKRFNDACQLLSERCRAFVLSNHHEGKDASKGMRGSSVLGAGVETVYRLARKDDTMLTELTVEKLKDDEGEGDVYPFEMISVPIGKGEDGDEITSLVPRFGGEVHRGSTKPGGGGKQRPLNPSERMVLFALRNGPLSFTELLVAGQFKHNSTLMRAVAGLLERSLIVLEGRRYRLVPSEDVLA